MVPSARAEFLGRRTATGRVSAAGCERDVAPRQNQLTGAAETKFVVCESPILAVFCHAKWEEAQHDATSPKEVVLDRRLEARQAARPGATSEGMPS
jgi:hypothetical protein